MARFIGSSTSETIAPGSVSPTVTRDPLGSIPGNDADTLEGYGGADTLRGGGGDDTIAGHGVSVSDDGATADTLHGDAGNDTLYLSTGGDRAYGDADDDILVVQYASGITLIDGGTGDDTLRILNGDITGATITGIERAELFDSYQTRMSAGQLDDIGALAGYEGASTATMTLSTGGTSSGVRTDASLQQLTIYGSGTTETVAFAAGSLTAIHYAGVAGTGSLTGGSADDVLEGGQGADILNGGAGEDRLYGNEAFSDGSNSAGDGTTSDTLHGNAGNDTLQVSTGGDKVYGDADDDLIVVTAATGAAVLDGGTGNDTLRVFGQDITGARITGIERTELGRYTDVMTATQLGDLGAIAGIDGENAVVVDLSGGGTSAEVETAADLSELTIRGSGLNETFALSAASRASLIYFGEYRGGNATSTVSGGAGEDIIQGGGGADTLHGGGGRDEIHGGSANVGTNDNAWRDLLYGDAGNDTIFLSTGGDEAYGGADDDLFVINGEVGRATLDGGTGRDTLNILLGDVSGIAVKNVEATEFTDQRATSLTAAQLDTLGTLAGYEGTGAVSLALTAGGVATGIRTAGSLQDLTITGSARSETIAFAASSRTDVTYEGGSGAGKVTGGAGADTLAGNGGADRLDGGAGNDILAGGEKKDQLTGGAGKDRFVFEESLVASNVDKIKDFSSRDDTIELENGYFYGLDEGRLKGNAFKNIDSGRVDASDHILYDESSGKLYFDADGSGASRAILFAVIDNDASLKASDFFVV